jgi:hypothetical protein
MNSSSYKRIGGDDGVTECVKVDGAAERCVGLRAALVAWRLLFRILVCPPVSSSSSR